MKYSSLFGKTVREVSRQITSDGNRLLLQAGFIRESTSGRYFLLPLGMRVRDRICTIVQEEMDLTGAQKLISPSLHPLELWEESGRAAGVSFELMKVTDRRNRTFALGGTAEEMIVDVVRNFKISYRELPFILYQFSQKFRDELRARGGLLRTREFLMKDAYSFHVSEECFLSFYEQMKIIYSRIFNRLGLSSEMVLADNGYMGGDYCHEFVVEHEHGESLYFSRGADCEAIHQEIARTKYNHCNPDEIPLDVVIQKALRGSTIEDGVVLYKQPAWRQIKTLIYCKEEKDYVLVALRGDLEVNEIKLQKALRTSNFRLAREDEVEKLGSCVGFVSPLKLSIQSIGDCSLTTVNNFYTGADEHHLDTLNVNYGRDFEVELLTDISLAREGDICFESGNRLEIKKGIEVGNIFQLGTHYSDRMKGAAFINESGKAANYFMGCYGIGIDRVLATIAETHRDEQGLIWPEKIAPFSIHLISLCKKKDEVEKVSACYQLLVDQGFDVLYDDRDVSAGVKFNDADLIGIPHRIVISSRTLNENRIEYRRRIDPEKSSITVNELIEILKKQEN